MKRLILVVDDDDKSRKLVSEFLAVKGFAVDEAADGEEGIVCVARRRPALILLDMKMPRLDGIRTIKRLKGDPATADIPVIMLSASAMENEKTAMREAGCHAILSKPVDLRALLTAVTDQLAECKIQT